MVIRRAGRIVHLLEERVQTRRIAKRQDKIELQNALERQAFPEPGLACAGHLAHVTSLCGPDLRLAESAQNEQRNPYWEKSFWELKHQGFTAGEI
jgi:hypothetical protein